MSSRPGAAVVLVAALLVVVAFGLGLARPAAGVAAQPPAGFVVVDEPDGAGDLSAVGAPRLRPSEVEQLARADRAIASALARRADARLSLRHRPAAAEWTATLRDRASGRLLASVDVRDSDGAVVARYELPLGSYPPRLTAARAVEIARADPAARRAAREFGGQRRLAGAARLDECCWEVDLYRPVPAGSDAPRTALVRVDVRDATGTVTGVWTGVQVAWKMARGERGAFGGDINDRWTWLPLFALFALVAVDWSRLRSAFTLDVAALLALGVSHEAFLQGNIDLSVPLAVPPLLWLLVRSLWIFVRGLPPQRPPAAPRSRPARLALRRVPTVAIVVLAVALTGLRIGVTLEGGNVIDVGYAGVAGARLELDARAPWGNMPADNPRGDTYGPANYLAYVPAVALLDDPERDDWGQPMPAAQATSIAADLGCALLLALIGWRWISRRGAALLAAGWMACPWTAWALASGVNDALLALPLLAAFALLRRPTLRGLFIGLAAMVKFAPLAVAAPLLHVGSRRRTRQVLLCSLGVALALAAGLAWVSLRIEGGPAHDLAVFWERTVGFQVGRGSPFSPWGLYEWGTAQRIAQGLVALGIVAACIRPRVRDAWQVAAGAAAVLIAAQLVVSHWFYLYVPWFLGFVLLVLVAARERPAAAPPAADMLAP